MAATVARRFSASRVWPSSAASSNSSRRLRRRIPVAFRLMMSSSVRFSLRSISPAVRNRPVTPALPLLFSICRHVPAYPLQHGRNKTSTCQWTSMDVRHPGRHSSSLPWPDDAAGPVAAAGGFADLNSSSKHLSGSGSTRLRSARVRVALKPALVSTSPSEPIRVGSGLTGDFTPFCHSV